MMLKHGLITIINFSHVIALQNYIHVDKFLGGGKPPASLPARCMGVSLAH